MAISLKLCNTFNNIYVSCVTMIEVKNDIKASLQRFLNSTKWVEKICVNLIDSPHSWQWFPFPLMQKREVLERPKGMG